MAVHVHVHRTTDLDTRSREEKLRALAERPGTPAEGAAAHRALKKMGVKAKPSGSEREYKRDKKGQFATTGAVAEHHGWVKKETSGGKTTWTHPKYKKHTVTTHAGSHGYETRHPYGGYKTGGHGDPTPSSFERRMKEFHAGE